MLQRAVHPEDQKKFSDELELLLSERKESDFTFRLISKGAILYLRASFRILSYDNNEFFIGTVQDVTAEEVTRKELTERVRLLELLSDAIPDIVLMSDENNNVLLWNKRCEELYGIKREKAVGENLFDLLPQLKTDEIIRFFNTALAGERVQLPNFQPMQPLKGFYNANVIPLRSEANRVVGLLHLLHDVTASHHLNLQLSSRLQFIEKLIEVSVDRIIALDRNMNYLYWNRKAEEYYGLKKESVIGKNILEIFPRHQKLPSYAQFREALRGHTVHIPIDSREMEDYTETYLVPVPNDRGEAESVLWIAHDLTKEYELLAAQQKAQRELEDSKALVRAALDSSQLIIQVLEAVRNEDGDIIDFRWLLINQQAEAVLGKVTGERLLENHPGVVESGFFDKYVQVTESGRALNFEQQYTYQSFNQWYNVTVVKLNDGVVITSLDITERRKAEEKIKEQAHFITNITETVPDIITIMDYPSLDILYCNQEPLALYGFDMEEILKMSMEQKAGLIHQDDLVATMQYFRRLGDFDDETIALLEYRARNKEGHWHWFLARGKVFQRDGAGKVSAILNIIQNITPRKKWEEELQKNLAILRNAEELAQIGSWEYEIATGKFNWSDGMYQLFDLTPGMAVKPETYLDFALEEDRSAAKRIIKSLKKTHQAFEETMRIKKGGESRILRIKSSLVNDEAGHPYKIVGVDLDITEIKEAEKKLIESQHLLEQTAMASPDAITIYDLVRKQPVYLNNCLAEWTGLTLEELVNMGIEGRLQLIHPDDRLSILHFNEKIGMANDGDVLTLEYRIASKSEQLRWIRNRSKVFQRDDTGKVTHILSILQDVSEEKAGERLLKSLNASLEKKNRDLESKNDEITSFAFVASHDLKEPLRKIHTFSDWLLTREPALTEEGKLNLKKLSNSVKQLDTLVEDILALTKVHVEREKWKEVDLNIVLQNAKLEMQEQIEKSGAQINAASLPVVKGMENQLLYLFRNLIGNSIKFQPKGNQPVIQIEATIESEFLHLSFRDNGIGFSQEFSAKIFEMFRRLHSRYDYEGTGMGLAICKKIMEKHGGHISAAGEPGKGATFTCSFPL